MPEIATEKRKILRCKKCGAALARHDGDKFTIFRHSSPRYNPGKQVIRIETKHYGSGHLRITCGDCGVSYIFVELAEKLVLDDKEVKKKID